MFGKEGPVFWWNLWLIKVGVFIILPFFAKMITSLFFGWNFVREE
jgi:hypothetical protein